MFCKKGSFGCMGLAGGILHLRKDRGGHRASISYGGRVLMLPGQDLGLLKVPWGSLKAKNRAFFQIIGGVSSRN